jgi:DNA-binding NarL/FixJ family response regulator
MLGASAEAERIVAAIRAGVVGWVHKAEHMEYLLRVIRGVTHGESWVPPSELGKVFQLLLHEQKSPHDDYPLVSLTARERQVLSHLADGASRKQIAERLQLSPHTVRSHMQNLMAKLGVHSALEAVALLHAASEWRQDLTPASLTYVSPAARIGREGAGFRSTVSLSFNLISIHISHMRFIRSYV